MAKAKRLKAQKQNRKYKDFLKAIGSGEPKFFIATVPGVGTVDLTDTFKERKAS